MQHATTAPATPRRFLHGILTTLTCLLLWPAAVWSQIDSFEDGDDVGWTHYDPLGALGAGPRGLWLPTNSAYRIVALRSPNPSVAGPARAASLRQSVNYSDFHVTVDVVDWANLDQAFGIIVRIQPNPGLGATAGYSLTYQTDDGDIQLSVIADEEAQAIAPSSSSIATVRLYPTNAYRFVLRGEGANLTGQVFLRSDLSTPLATVEGNHAQYTSGTAGLVVYDNSSGGGGTADVTFDNYYAAPREAPSLQFELTAAEWVLISWPTNASGFILQRSPSIATPVWSDVLTDIFQQDDRYFLLEGTSGQGEGCFRLRYEP